MSQYNDALCTKHHLSNIWSSINETLSNTKTELRKAFLKKTIYFIAFE